MRLKIGIAASLGLAGILGLRGPATASPTAQGSPDPASAFVRPAAGRRSFSPLRNTLPRVEAEPRAPGAALAALADVPLYFEDASGPAGSPAGFVARAGNCHFLLGPRSVQLLLRRGTGPRPEAGPPGDAAGLSAQAIRMEFAGANPNASMRGLAETGAKINYLVGPDAAQWRVGVSTYARVGVPGLYPGIDLVYYGNQHRFEYDFALAAGADPRAIAIRFAGADRVAISDQGDLVLGVAGEEIRQPRPTIYQVVGGARRAVAGGYRLTGADTVAFELGRYDPSLPLVIDPVLVYSSYLGGDSSTRAYSVKVDAAGFVYVAGTTGSFLMPFAAPAGPATNILALGANGPIRGRFFGDAFVAKFDRTLTNLVFFTYLGGTNDDGAFDMALDSASNVYLTGWTDSTNFPVVLPASGVPGWSSATHISGKPYPIDGSHGAYPVDAFVAELDASGSKLIYSGYIGGDLEDVGESIAVEANTGAAFVTGFTASTNFPVTAGACQTRLGNRRPSILGGATNTINAFLVKIAPGGTNLQYATYLGGDHYDYATGVALDAAGYPCIAGYTVSTNFPTTADALQPWWALNHSTNAPRQFRGTILVPSDGFLARFDPARPGAGSLLYSSLLGGTNSDRNNALTADAQTNVYVVGYSYSADFPGHRAPPGLFFAVSTNRDRIPTNSDAFLTKFNFSAGTPTLSYSLLFGSTNNDTATTVALGSTNVYVGGFTVSTNFPTTNTFQFLARTNAGGQDGFIAAFSNDGSNTLYSAYLGGGGSDFIYSLAADAAGDAYLVGETYSTDFPEVQPFQSPSQRTNNAFLAKIKLTNATVQVIIATSPAASPLGTNLLVVIDGVTNRAPVTNRWWAGSRHVISTPLVQGGPTNYFTGDADTQYVWSSWSHGGLLTNTIYPISDTNYTASFVTRYFLTVTTTNGGGVNFGSGWYAAGSNLTLLATPGFANAFDHWEGTGSNSYSGVANPASISMNSPIAETAAFSGALAARLVIVTNGVGRVTPDLTGQSLQVGRRYSLTASPGAGYLFGGWTGAVVTNRTEISFTMAEGLVLEAHFLTNPYVASVGNYAGLYYDTNNFQEESSGYFTASVTSSGRFSSRLRFGNVAYSLSGQFSTSGSYYGFIRRSSDTNISNLAVALQLDLAGGTSMSGQVSDGTWTAQIQSFRSPFSAANPPPQRGQKFTFIIPGTAQYLSQPGGAGYGTLTVDNSGNLSLGFHLGEGATFSQSAPLSPQSQWPLYAALYSGGGSILGWLTLTNQATNDLSGRISWYKPPQIYARYYPGGFTVETDVLGSLYSATNGVAMLNFGGGATNGQVALQNGDLTQNLTNLITVGTNNVVTDHGTNRLSLALTSSSGLFHGSFRSPYRSQTWAVNGVVLQKQNYGAGYFLGTNHSGAILMRPR